MGVIFKLDPEEGGALDLGVATIAAVTLAVAGCLAPPNSMDSNP